MNNRRESVTEHGKQFRERPTVAAAQEISDEQESTQNLASPIRQNLQAKFGHAEVDMALSGEDHSPSGTFILSEWAMGTAGLGSLTEESPEAGAHIHGMLRSEEWGQTAAGIISRYATSNEPAHAHLAVELIRRSRGQRLPRDVTARLSSALGVDISDAIIHTDTAAAQAAEAVNAHAFATGKDVFFAAGKFQPGTKDGDELLAHELTHVVQDAEGRIPYTSGEGLTVSTPNQTHEREAERAGSEAASMLHDSGMADHMDLSAELSVGDEGLDHGLQTTEGGDVLHRSSDDFEALHTYGAGEAPSSEERKALKATMPSSQWNQIRKVEKAYHSKVVPNIGNIATVVSDVALDAEDYCMDVFEFIDTRLIAMEDKEAAEEMADERESDDHEELEEEGYESEEYDQEEGAEEGSPAADTLMEAENEELQWFTDDADTSIKILDQYQQLLGLAFFGTMRQYGITFNSWAADGELAKHSGRVDYASLKTQEALELLKNFERDVLFEVVERELKSKAKDLTISLLVGLVLPPAGAGLAAAKTAKWAATEIAGLVVDVMTSDGQAPKYDQDFVNSQTKKWTGYAGDVKKLASDTEKLTGPWERIDVLNKTLGRVMKIIEVQDIAKEKLAKINQALDVAKSANDKVTENWPKVLKRYQKFQAKAEYLARIGPAAAKRAQIIYEEIDRLEGILYAE